MKDSIVMLCSIITFILVWCFFALLCWWFTDLSYKMCMISDGTLQCLIAIGWIPSVIVGYDVNELLKK
jgi:hypothetical protein